MRCYCGADLLSYSDLKASPDPLLRSMADMYVGPRDFFCWEEDDVIPREWAPTRWRRLRRKSPVRSIRERGGFTLYVGPWACRYSWSRVGVFSNGSRWSSGWHRWNVDDLF